MNALIAIAAVGIDALCGEPRRWHPLVGFGRCANRVEAWLQAPAATFPAQRWRGVFAVVLLLAPCTFLAAAFSTTQSLGPHFDAAFSIAVLYLTLGHRSLREHARRVHAALALGDLVLARTRLSHMVSRDTGDMDATRVAAATIESVLENGNDAVFGTLFWFAVAGAPGALCYRLANTLDAMWGYRTERFRYFGWAAARFDDVLNFCPARLTAISYALLGHTARAVRCWRVQAHACESPNAGPVMSAGAGALSLSLGGGAWYHGAWKDRPRLGEGDQATADAIPRALNLVLRTLLLWLLAFAAITLIGE